MVAPRAMHQKQFAKEPELGNRHVGRPGSLQTFNTTDTNADMGGLDHRHVVGAVTNRQQ